MKKRLLTFLVLVISICFISTRSFAQAAPGGSGDVNETGGTDVSTVVTDISSDPSKGTTPDEFVDDHPDLFTKCQSKSTCNHNTRKCSHTQSAPCTHASCYRSNVVDLFCKGRVNFSSFLALYNYDPSKNNRNNSGGCRR